MGQSPSHSRSASAASPGSGSGCGDKIYLVNVNINHAKVSTNAAGKIVYCSNKKLEHIIGMHINMIPAKVEYTPAPWITKRG